MPMACDWSGHTGSIAYRQKKVNGHLCAQATLLRLTKALRYSILFIEPEGLELPCCPPWGANLPAGSFLTNRKNLTGEKELSSGQVFSAGLSRGQSAKGGMAAVEAVNGCGEPKGLPQPFFRVQIARRCTCRPG